MALRYTSLRLERRVRLGLSGKKLAVETTTLPSQPEIDRLVARLCVGEVEALETLYDCYAGQVYGFLLRSVEPGVAEELLQDVFLTLWQKAAQYDATLGSFNAWFFTLVRHRLYDVLRKQPKLRIESLFSLLEVSQAQPDFWEDNQVGTEELVLQLLRTEEIRQALRELPIEQRQIIFMTYFGGFSQRELADQLNLPVSTVKGRARLGLKRLRQLVTE